MLTYISFFILILVCIYFALIFESAPFAMLAFGLALFVVLSFFYLLYMKFTLKVRLASNSKVVNKNEVIKIYLNINNKNIFKITKVYVVAAYHNIAKGTTKKTKSLIEDVPVNSSQGILSTYFTEPGKYECIIKKLYIYDRTGVFRIKYKVKGKVDIVVFPKLENIAVEVGFRVKNFYLDTDYSDELRPGTTNNDIFDVKEYRPGDKLQLIHWRISAKYDDLYIRERTDNKPCSIVLFYDPADNKSKYNSLDYVSSLSFSLMSENIPHFVAWYSKTKGDVIRARVSDEESFFVFILSMIQDIGSKNIASLVEEYGLVYKGDNYVHSVVFNNSDNCILDGKAYPLTNMQDMYYFFD